MTGTGGNGPVAARSTSLAIPEPPMPSTTMCSIRSRFGSPSRPRAATAASKTCSGRWAATSHIPAVSRTSSTRSGIERRADALGVGLRREPLVLRIVGGDGLVDEHHRDVVADLVLPLEPRVVEDLLVLEVQQGALVLRAGQDLQQLR